MFLKPFFAILLLVAVCVTANKFKEFEGQYRNTGMTKQNNEAVNVGSYSWNFKTLEDKDAAQINLVVKNTLSVRIDSTGQDDRGHIVQPSGFQSNMLHVSDQKLRDDERRMTSALNGLQRIKRKDPRHIQLVTSEFIIDLEKS